MIAGKPKWKKWKTIGACSDISLDTAGVETQKLNTTLANWTLNGSRGGGPFKETCDELTMKELLDDNAQRQVRAQARIQTQPKKTPGGGMLQMGCLINLLSHS